MRVWVHQDKCILRHMCIMSFEHYDACIMVYVHFDIRILRYLHVMTCMHYDTCAVKYTCVMWQTCIVTFGHNVMRAFWHTCILKYVHHISLTCALCDVCIMIGVVYEKRVLWHKWICWQILERVCSNERTRCKQAQCDGSLQPQGHCCKVCGTADCFVYLVPPKLQLLHLLHYF